MGKVEDMRAMREAQWKEMELRKERQKAWELGAEERRKEKLEEEVRELRTENERLRAELKWERVRWGGRPRKYSSNAERQKAYRQRRASRSESRSGTEPSSG